MTAVHDDPPQDPQQDSQTGDDAPTVEELSQRLEKLREQVRDHLGGTSK